MSLEIKLSNPYFHWEKQIFEGVSCYFKGDLFYKNDILTAEKLMHLISSMNLTSRKCELHELQTFLKDLNGEYALIIESPHEVICAVDRVRSIPLFYSLNNEHFIISDDAYYIKNKIKPNLKEENAAEFLVTGYVTGNETLFENINQLQAGEVLIYNKEVNSLQTSYYFRYIHKDFMNLTEEEMLSGLDACFVSVFRRLIDSTVNKGKQIVVPLSGGLDSRIIVAMLKRFGVENVICFTYGRKNDREVKISKQVAEALGYEWHFVEYTREKWYNAYNSKDMVEYQKYAGNLVSLPVIQDYLAVKILKKQGILPENSVFVPGHSGDMLAGSHIPKNYANISYDYKQETFLKDSLKKHYNLLKWNDKQELKPIFENKITKSVGTLDIYNNESCANAVELFNFNERQAKYIVNSVRAYEFFGYEWRIPMWDAELINYFKSITIEYRINTQIYKKYAVISLFVDKLQDLQKINCTTDILESSTIFYNIFFSIFRKPIQLFNYYFDVRWGRYFKKPLFSRAIMKYKKCSLAFPQNLHLLNSILYLSKKKGLLISLGGYQTLAYILKVTDDLDF